MTGLFHYIQEASELPKVLSLKLKKSKFGNQKLQFLAVLMPFKEKHHAVAYLKVLVRD